MAEAFVLIRVQPARLEEVANLMKTVKEEISRVKGVKEIKGVFGRYDFVATVNVESLHELGTLVTNTIRNIRGVTETETLVVGF